VSMIAFSPSTLCGVKKRKAVFHEDAFHRLLLPVKCFTSASLTLRRFPPTPSLHLSPSLGIIGSHCS
jgi:hypothetical protein